MTLHFKQVVYRKYRLQRQELQASAGGEGGGVARVWGEGENS